MPKAAVLDRQKRSTAGTRMSALIGQAEQDDDTFWSHSTWREVAGDGTASDDGSFHESDEESDAKVDTFDSDFDDSEEENEDGVDEEGEAEVLLEEKRAKRAKGKKMMDIVNAGREMMHKKKNAAQRRKAIRGNDANAGLVLNMPGSQPILKGFGRGRHLRLAVNNLPSQIASAPASSIPAQSSNVAKKPLTTLKRSSMPPPPRRSSRSKSPKYNVSEVIGGKRSLRTSTLNNTIQASTSCIKREQQQQQQEPSTKSKWKRKFTQEELLQEAVETTELDNARWILNRKRTQIEENIKAEIKMKAGQNNTKKKVICKFNSRRGCLNTLTFPEMDYVPEIFTRARRTEEERLAETAKVKENNTCVISGKLARYRDPKTKLGYHDLAAFKELRRRFEVGEPLKQDKVEKTPCSVQSKDMNGDSVDHKKDGDTILPSVVKSKPEPMELDENGIQEDKQHTEEKAIESAIPPIAGTKSTTPRTTLKIVEKIANREVLPPQIITSTSSAPTESSARTNKGMESGRKPEQVPSSSTGKAKAKSKPKKSAKVNTAKASSSIKNEKLETKPKSEAKTKPETKPEHVSEVKVKPIAMETNTVGSEVKQCDNASQKPQQSKNQRKRPISKITESKPRANGNRPSEKKAVNSTEHATDSMKSKEPSKLPEKDKKCVAPNALKSANSTKKTDSSTSSSTASASSCSSSAEHLTSSTFAEPVPTQSVTANKALSAKTIQSSRKNLATKAASAIDNTASLSAAIGTTVSNTPNHLAQTVTNMNPSMASSDVSGVTSDEAHFDAALNASSASSTNRMGMDENLAGLAAAAMSSPLTPGYNQISMTGNPAMSTQFSGQSIAPLSNQLPMNPMTMPYPSFSMMNANLGMSSFASNNQPSQYQIFNPQHMDITSMLSMSALRQNGLPLQSITRSQQQIEHNNQMMNLLLGQNQILSAAQSKTSASSSKSGKNEKKNTE